MLKGKAVWDVHDDVDAHVVKALIDRLQMNEVVARLLVRRGLRTPEQVLQFMNMELSDFHDPLMLKGMSESVARIHQAISSSEHIWVYGDYDADGVTATSLMLTVLRQLGGNVNYYIPHRVDEGYGLNKVAIDEAVEQQVTLIITVDNGISAHEDIEYALTHSIDIIVTDHHEPPPELPAAYAIINPKQPECTYPFKQLAGVGVAFKLAHALTGSIPMGLIQHAAIGTVADIVPLIDENRLIVKLGLEQLRQQPLTGVAALAMISGVEQDRLNEGHIAYHLAPRINAAGRIAAADKGVKLLTTADVAEAEQLATGLEQLNRERQLMVQEILMEAQQLLEDRQTAHVDTVFVLAKEQWHVGVIGIVASKFVEQFHRPTIILHIDRNKGIAKGSARSIPGFDMYRALSECASLLSHYGGHQMAAGMTLPVDNIERFKAAMNALANEWLTEADLVPVIQAEMACTIEELSLPCIEAIETMAPFGEGNPNPSFVLHNLRLHDMRMIGKDKQHLKLLTSQENGDVKHTLDGIGFGMGEKGPFISPNARIDLLGEITINEWNGIRKPQLIIRDLRVNERQVFDWRGMATDQWLSRIDGEWRPAILLTASEMKDPALDEHVQSHCPLFAVNENGEIKAANDVATRTDYSTMKDLIIYSLPVNIQQLQAALKQALAVERLYIAFKNDDQTTGILPSRDSFRKVYGELLHLQQWQINDQRTLQGLQRRTGVSQDTLRFMLNVFYELSFIELTGTSCRFVTAPDHRSLSSSASYLARKQRAEVQDILVYSTTQELIHWSLQQLPDNKLTQSMS